MCDTTKSVSTELVSNNFRTKRQWQDKKKIHKSRACSGRRQRDHREQTADAMNIFTIRLALDVFLSTVAVELSERKKEIKLFNNENVMKEAESERKSGRLRHVEWLV